MTKKIEVPKETTGYGYVGVWSDGLLGNIAPGNRAYLCKVTITPVLDKRGRPITIVKKEGGV